MDLSAYRLLRRFEPLDFLDRARNALLGGRAQSPADDADQDVGWVE
jgi:hypothetical protein